MPSEVPAPTLTRTKARRWIAHLWREWIVESRRPIAPAAAKPHPAEWRADTLTATWLGHATVLINFFGVNIITDPALFPRVGIRIPWLLTIGPKRLTAPALTIPELPRIDVILLSHAHFDHLDLRTLRALRRRNGRAHVVTAPRTKDLLRGCRFAEVTELPWGESIAINTPHGELKLTGWRVKHWGARVQRDTHRGYGAYVLERNGRRILFGGDTARTDAFRSLGDCGGVDLAILSIGAYNPWIRSHATPEEAVAMANDAGARFIMPIHHQTFRLSAEPMREPIERFANALRTEPERIALREIGETFTLPDPTPAPPCS